MKLDGGVDAYLGIPYAAAPIGDLRWRAPAPAETWQGVRPTMAFAPTCTQAARGPGQNHYFGPEPTSEDCLYLNVWTPATARPGSKLAVVVYIHGGGFTSGAGSQMWARGQGLAAKGVVAVSINYRLGSLGFMAHPELTAENGGRGSGGYAFLDQIAALKWIKANIGRFGGDPDNVTLMGQSAGSMSLSVLGASSMAAGLFKREIGLSGSLLSEGGTGSVASLADAEKQGLALQNALGAKSLADLRRLPADRVVGPAGIRTGPSVDGAVLAQTPSAIFAAGKENDVGLMVSFASDESFSGLGSARSREGYEALVRQSYPDNADEILKRYPADANWAKNSRMAARDLSTGPMMWRWAEEQRKLGKQPVYAFLYTRVHPYPAGISFIDHDPKTAGAYHAGDIVYWTGTLEGFNAYKHTRDWTPWDVHLSDTITDMVVAYARSGDPRTKAMPAVQFDPANARMVELGDKIQVIDWPNRQNVAFIASLPAPRQGNRPPAAATAPAMEGGPRN